MKVNKSDGRYGNEEVEKVFFEEEFDKLMPHQKYTPWTDDSTDSESSTRVKTTVGRFDHDEIEIAVAAPPFVDNIDHYDTDTTDTLAKYRAICEDEIHYSDVEDVLLDNDSEEADPRNATNDFAKKHVKRVAILEKASIPPQVKIDLLIRDFREAHQLATKLAASKLPSSQLYALKNKLSITLEEIDGECFKASKMDNENSTEKLDGVITRYERELENCLAIIQATPKNRLYYLNERADAAAIKINEKLNEKLNAFAKSLNKMLAWATKTFTLKNVVSTMDTIKNGLSSGVDAVTAWMGEKWNHLKNRNTPESEYIAPAEIEITDMQTNKVERMFAFHTTDRSSESSHESDEDETLSQELDPHWDEKFTPPGLSTKEVADLLAENDHTKVPEKKRTIIYIDLDPKPNYAEVVDRVKSQLDWEELDSILDKSLDVDIAPPRTGLSKIWHWISEKFQSVIGRRENEEYIPSEEFEMALAADKPITQQPRMFSLHANSETSEYAPEDEEEEELSHESANTTEIVRNLHLFDHLDQLREHKVNPAPAAPTAAIDWEPISLDHD